ncbi:hypothetical protein [Lentzea aerocolonigenes]|uniref:hypothetical protein n=1 Tax=Lentzea aerocolonigenes TaxID=68170 RepID=UPI0004C45999|nr:hypothetical protein [Lentzea aerocolonigenes]MCP2248545.1 hypothetical protein [Lentzea aerocolonigenes]
MRKIIVALAGCLVLSGCGAAEWREKVRFKVDKIYEVAPKYDRKYATLRLELVGEVPDDALEPDTVSPQVVDRFEIRGEVVVGDEVVCAAEQKTSGYADADVIRTDLLSCEKA